MKIRKLLSGNAADTGTEHKSQGTSTTNSSLSSEDGGTVVASQSRIPALPDYQELQPSSQWISESTCKTTVHTCCPSGSQTIKEELLRSSLIQQHLQLDKGELQKVVIDREQQLQDIRKELGGRDRLIQQQKSQLDEAMRNLTLANKAKAFLTTQLADQDKKLALFEQYRDPKLLIREELQVARDALQSLRKSFKKNDPHHHTIDTLEQSIALLMERLHFAEMEKVVTENLKKQLTYDSYGTIRSCQLALPSSKCYSSSVNSSSNHPHLTKVIYFTDKTVTPYLSSIPKSLGEITLKDFKQLLDKPGNFRYHFKSVDPEYGMVKEELLHDDDILPGWENKIIAWVESDHG